MFYVLWHMHSWETALPTVRNTLCTSEHLKVEQTDLYDLNLLEQ